MTSSRPPSWPGASVDLPAVPELEALGMAVPLYLPTLMDERPDPQRDGWFIVDGHFAPGPHLVDEDGRVGMGVLSTLVDNVGGMVNGLAVLPDWIVTTNLTVRRAARPPDGPAGPDGPLDLVARVLRRGRSTAVCDVDITAADGRRLATAVMTSSILTPEMGPPPVPRPLKRRQVPTVDDPLYSSPPGEFFDLRPGDLPGEIRLDAPPRVRNPWGIVHGGAIAIAVDAAARAAVAHPTGIDVDTDDLGVTDLAMHFLSPGRVGPLVALGELIGSRGDDHLVRVTVRDRGADDRLLTMAALTVRPT